MPLCGSLSTPRRRINSSALSTSVYNSRLALGQRLPAVRLGDKFEHAAWHDAGACLVKLQLIIDAVATADGHINIFLAIDTTNERVRHGSTAMIFRRIDDASKHFIALNFRQSSDCPQERGRFGLLNSSTKAERQCDNQADGGATSFHWITEWPVLWIKGRGGGHISSTQICYRG